MTNENERIELEEDRMFQEEPVQEENKKTKDFKVFDVDFGMDFNF